MYNSRLQNYFCLFRIFHIETNSDLNLPFIPEEAILVENILLLTALLKAMQLIVNYLWVNSFIFCRCSTSRGLFHGSNWRPHSLWCQEASRQSCQDRKVRLQRWRDIDRRARPVREEVPRVHEPGHSVENWNRGVIWGSGLFCRPFKSPIDPLIYAY